MAVFLPPSLPPHRACCRPQLSALSTVPSSTPPPPLGTLGSHLEARIPTPAGLVCREGASLHGREKARGSCAEHEGFGMGCGPPGEAEESNLILIGSPS